MKEILIFIQNIFIVTKQSCQRDSLEGCHYKEECDFVAIFLATHHSNLPFL